MEPSILQKRLYEDFSQSSASHEVASIVRADDTDASGRDQQAPKAPHVFQVCSLCPAFVCLQVSHIPLLRNLYSQRWIEERTAQ